MKLYHGSDVAVNQPLAKVGRHNLDFGEGFYICFVSQKAIDGYLKFEKSTTIDKKED